jgi:hypothetical protein
LDDNVKFIVEVFSDCRDRDKSDFEVDTMLIKVIINENVCK